MFRDSVRMGGAIMPSGHGGASMNSVINNEYAYCGISSHLQNNSNVNNVLPSKSYRTQIISPLLTSAGAGAGAGARAASRPSIQKAAGMRSGTAQMMRRSS